MVGIEAAVFTTSHYFIDLSVLAEARGVATDKYYVGLGQKQMAVFPPDEDIVTLGASAGRILLGEQETDQIGMLLFATESGIDQSKAAGMYLHRLLALPKNCRVLELKQACYSATAAILLALEWLNSHPTKKVLVIASDIARYGLNMPGEPSQGGGAVALLLSTEPKLLRFEAGSGIYTEEAMDFWRPNYRDEALVDGKYSCDLYLKALKEAWQDYTHNTGRQYADHDYFLFHIPLPRMAEKGLQKLGQINQQGRLSEIDLKNMLGDSLNYSRTIGNCYTASLYLGFLSLLEHRNDLAGKRLGFYSYGSGSIGEFFSGIVLPDYQKYLFSSVHQDLLKTRTALSVSQYESFYQYVHPQDGSDVELPKMKTGSYRLKGFAGHQRLYEANLTERHHVVTARAPAKLILTGEHAVVQGVPAIAVAINLYCDTTITPNSLPKVLFDLANLEHKRSRTLHYLGKLKAKVKGDYQKFLTGNQSIRQVLKQPFQLLEYTAGTFIEKLQIKMHEGFSVKTDSNIPTGYGLGSSAAAIVSLNFALNNFTGNNMSIEELFQLNLDSENLQHGHSSGLDLYISAHGGCIRFMAHQNQAPIEYLAPPDFPLCIILTGEPESTTGECVAHSQAVFEKNPQWLTEFHKVSEQIYQSILKQDLHAFKQGITENEGLLEKIGVVPMAVQNLMRRLEARGFAAKICGAGSIRGERAGAILVVAPNTELANFDLCLTGAKLISIEIAQEGVAIIC